mmetsp:Transcript_24977/g.75217  ORF Transcript_24977/g.75217 Transcript_24977/m.75217 type:complete len:230 (-) Transcript_24977:1041-1730(-)
MALFIAWGDGARRLEEPHQKLGNRINHGGWAIPYWPGKTFSIYQAKQKYSNVSTTSIPKTVAILKGSSSSAGASRLLHCCPCPAISCRAITSMPNPRQDGPSRHAAVRCDASSCGARYDGMKATKYSSPPAAAAVFAESKKVDKRKQKVMVEEAYSTSRTHITLKSLFSKMRPNTSMTAISVTDIIMKRKYLMNHAAQCTHDVSPIIFIASLSRACFSSTRPRVMDNAV